ARSRGDADGDREHLRAVLDSAPGDLGALTALSEIAWEQGAWDEAASALIARARQESEPARLQAIFMPRGLVYADRQPDPPRAIQAFTKVLSYDADDRGALEHLSRLGVQTRDWKLALGACERLLKVDRDDDARVDHLHRIAQIYEDGFNDQARAERAYRAAL